MSARVSGRRWFSTNATRPIGGASAAEQWAWLMYQELLRRVSG